MLPITSRTLLVVVLAAATAVLAQPAATQQAQDAGYRIGVVDMQALIADYPKRQRAYNQLEEEVRQLQVEIDNMSAQIEAQKTNFEQRRDTMSEQERLAMANQIEEDFADYRRELERRQRLIDDKEDEVLSEILNDIHEAIGRVAQQDGFHLILNTSRGARGAVVVWSSPTIDITPRVQEVLGTG